ncbi:hypothetical protein DFJ73DRAFT_893449, partial [Zopfochytrium polystomum]
QKRTKVSRATSDPSSKGIAAQATDDDAPNDNQPLLMPDREMVSRDRSQADPPHQPELDFARMCFHSSLSSPATFFNTKNVVATSEELVRASSQPVNTIVLETLTEEDVKDGLLHPVGPYLLQSLQLGGTMADFMQLLNRTYSTLCSVDSEEAKRDLGADGKGLKDTKDDAWECSSDYEDARSDMEDEIEHPLAPLFKASQRDILFALLHSLSDAALERIIPTLFKFNIPIPILLSPRCDGAGLKQLQHLSEYLYRRLLYVETFIPGSMDIAFQERDGEVLGFVAARVEPNEPKDSLFSRVLDDFIAAAALVLFGVDAEDISQKPARAALQASWEKVDKATSEQVKPILLCDFNPSMGVNKLLIEKFCRKNKLNFKNAVMWTNTANGNVFLSRLKQTYRFDFETVFQSVPELQSAIGKSMWQPDAEVDALLCVIKSSLDNSSSFLPVTAKTEEISNIALAFKAQVDLRTNQDLGYETASELLERLKTEREELALNPPENGVALLFCAILRKGDPGVMKQLVARLENMFATENRSTNNNLQIEYNRAVQDHDLISSLENKRQLNQQTSIHSLWRELAHIYDLFRNDKSFQERYFLKRSEVVAYYCDWMNSGQAMQILDSSSNHVMNADFVSQVLLSVTDTIFRNLQSRKQALECLTFCISMIGATSSGKSFLFNMLFSCGFKSSAGTCTKGIYLAVMYTFFNNKCVVLYILDTEGLMAVEPSSSDAAKERGTQFDNKMALLSFLMSDAVLFNVKAEIGSDVENILQICVAQLESLRQADFNVPCIHFIQRDMCDLTKRIQQHSFQIMKFLGECNTHTLFYFFYIKKKLGDNAKELGILSIDSIVKLHEDFIHLLPHPFERTGQVDGEDLTMAANKISAFFSSRVRTLSSSLLETLIEEENARENKKNRTMATFCADLEATVTAIHTQAGFIYLKNMVKIKEQNMLREIITKQLDAVSNFCQDCRVLIKKTIDTLRESKLLALSEVDIQFKNDLESEFVTHLEATKNELKSSFGKDQKALDESTCMMTTYYEKAKLNVLQEWNLGIREFRQSGVRQDAFSSMGKIIETALADQVSWMDKIKSTTPKGNTELIREWKVDEKAKHLGKDSLDTVNRFMREQKRLLQLAKWARIEERGRALYKEIAKSPGRSTESHVVAAFNNAAKLEDRFNGTKKYNQLVKKINRPTVMPSKTVLCPKDFERPFNEEWTIPILNWKKSKRTELNTDVIGEFNSLVNGFVNSIKEDSFSLDEKTLIGWIKALINKLVNLDVREPNPLMLENLAGLKPEFWAKVKASQDEKKLPMAVFEEAKALITAHLESGNGIDQIVENSLHKWVDSKTFAKYLYEKTTDPRTAKPEDAISYYSTPTEFIKSFFEKDLKNDAIDISVRAEVNARVNEALRAIEQIQGALKNFVTEGSAEACTVSNVLDFNVDRKQSLMNASFAKANIVVPAKLTEILSWLRKSKAFTEKLIAADDDMIIELKKDAQTLLGSNNIELPANFHVILKHTKQHPWVFDGESLRLTTIVFDSSKTMYGNVSIQEPVAFAEKLCDQFTAWREQLRLNGKENLVENILQVMTKSILKELPSYWNKALCTLPNDNHQHHRTKHVFPAFNGTGWDETSHPVLESCIEENIQLSSIIHTKDGKTTHIKFLEWMKKMNDKWLPLERALPTDGHLENLKRTWMRIRRKVVAEYGLVDNTPEAWNFYDS